MARGRMLSKSISLDKRIAKLSSDGCRLAFTWAIAHLDCEGRIYGDPCALCSIVFPRDPTKTPDVVEGYIQEWADCGLVLWYEADDDRWLQFAGFGKNNKVNKDREAASVAPDPGENPESPVSDEVQSNSGVDPDEIHVNLKSKSKSKSKSKRKRKTPSETADAATGVVAGENGDVDYHEIMTAFQSKSTISDYGKQGKAIREMQKKAKMSFPDEPHSFLLNMVAKFWEMKQTNRQAFWKDAAFQPSMLNSRWDQVAEQLRAPPEGEEEMLRKLVDGFEVPKGRGG
tara:strand:+ start:244 stop:1101 length:858 start_codon:yes stop_codon:yes gene_type:complete